MVFKTREEQRYGRNKNTVVQHTYIESGEYRKKFDLISNTPKLNKLLYHLAKKMLFHRSGTLFEDMYWIDSETLEIVAKETTRNIEREVRYTRKTKKVIKQYSNLITIHSHPSSYPPSLDDLNSNWHNNYGIGIVCCHNGTIYMYQSNERINKSLYKAYVEKFRKQGYDETNAQYNALKKLQENYDIKIKEVSL